MEKLLKKFLVLNNYSNLTEEFNDLYLSHPNYPSLFAINDALDTLKVDNTVTRISKDQFEDLPVFFLAVINESTISEELVLVDKTNSNIVIHYKNRNSDILKNIDFINIWDGIVLGIEPNIEKKNSFKINNTNWFYLLPLVLVFTLIFYNSFSWINLFYLSSSLIGFVFSVFIVQEKLSLTEKSIFKFCDLSEEVSCSSVIKSDQSILFGFLSLSDLPLIFFGSSLLSFILDVNSSSSIIGLLSLISIPVILYSIWLQKVKLKKWCILCLVISLILIFNAVIYYFFLSKMVFYAYSSYFKYIVALVLVVSSWLRIKQIVSKNIELDVQNKELRRFKRNYKIFKMLIDSKLVLTQDFQYLEKIKIGDPEAKVELDLILSPNCKYCHIAFKESLSLTRDYPDKISLNILFNVSQDNPSVAIPHKILQIKKNTPEKVVEALSDWHIDNLLIEHWNKKWDLVIEEGTKTQIQTQYNWFEKNGFNSVPVKLVNGSVFPSEYDLQDLKYFISEMTEDVIS